ncbi:FMN-binding protein [Wukongibacter baidiensis]|uniref:FMN-binding protein n=1 Tax=Wukongibacter baidiensis TaxID=1723361 RepID=UPI003D7FE315
MKKFFSILLTFLLVFSIAACAPEKTEEPEEPVPEEEEIEEPEEEMEEPEEEKETEEEEEADEGKYKDGTYEGKGDPWEYGSENATVVIADGKMEEITLRRLDKEGNEVNYDDWAGQEVEGKTYPNLKQYRKDIAKEMIEKQTYEVDTISGATVSTGNWKIAVKRALEEATK